MEAPNALKPGLTEKLYEKALIFGLEPGVMPFVVRSGSASPAGSPVGALRVNPRVTERFMALMSFTQASNRDAACKLRRKGPPVVAECQG